MSIKVRIIIILAVQGMINICSGCCGSRRGRSRTDGSFNVVMATALTNQIAALSIIIIICSKDDIQ